MPRTITKEIFKFPELSDSAKEKARYWYRSTTEYTWLDENLQSLRKWGEWMHVKIKNYNLGGSDNRHNHIEWETDIDEGFDSLIGVRLWKYFQNQFAMPDLSGNCPFTGNCFDEVLLDRFREFMEHPWDTSYRKLIQESIDAFVESYAEDVDAEYSDEQVDEALYMNDYEFYEDGSPF